MSILTYILSCLYFFLPAYFTNMIPPLARKMDIFNCLDKEVDFGKKFMGEPIFGSHKSWRGVIFGIILGMSVAGFQFWLYRFPSVRNISFLNYYKIDILVFGFLISAGAIFGDLLSAFVKRRLKLAPGTKFLPFDQTNYVIGAALFLTPVFKIDILVWINLFILTFLLHIIFNRLGYLLKIHRAKW